MGRAETSGRRTDAGGPRPVDTPRGRADLRNYTAVTSAARGTAFDSLPPAEVRAWSELTLRSEEWSR